MEKSVIFICESGISASLFVSKMLEAVKNTGVNYDIDYAPIARAEEKLSYKDYDVILLAPQVRRYEEEIKDIILKRKCISKIIPITDDEFVSMNVGKILDKINS